MTNDKFFIAEFAGSGVKDIKNELIIDQNKVDDKEKTVSRNKMIPGNS